MGGVLNSAHVLFPENIFETFPQHLANFFRQKHHDCVYILKSKRLCSQGKYCEGSLLWNFQNFNRLGEKIYGWLVLVSALCEQRTTSVSCFKRSKH